MYLLLKYTKVVYLNLQRFMRSEVKVIKIFIPTIELLMSYQRLWLHDM